MCCKAVSCELFLFLFLLLISVVLIRYAHILQTLTLLCLLTALILYNIKLYHADAFAWNIVFVPMLALCAMWLIVLLSITMGSAVSYYKLQVLYHFTSPTAPPLFFLIGLI